MVPYVRKSFRKHYNDGLKYLENSEEQVEVIQSIEWDFLKKLSMKAYQYAMDMTVKETQQAVEGMYHNLK